MPYKVSGTKLSKKVYNYYSELWTKAEIKAECKASGQSTFHMNPAYPSNRRIKRANQKAERGIKAAGRFERRIYSELMSEYAYLAENSIYGHP